jgi:2-polyprenyl-6-methoxyphenol hydroxylase-like FAD-dependent oxidoreductase
MDITLVGGGLAGLTISALLARAGHKVEMLVSDDVGRSRLGQPRSINLALSASLCRLTANLPRCDGRPRIKTSWFEKNVSF